MSRISIYITLITCILNTHVSMAEGTKELMPFSNIDTRILVSRNNLRDPFAVYQGNPDYRLYVHISDPYSEKIYFGLGQSTGGAVNWRLHAPDGTVVWPTPPSNITTPTVGQTGYINNYTEATNGPNVLNPAGYNALSYQPTVSGDFFLTFELNANQERDYAFFDITVVNAGSIPVQALPGRVFSKCWQVRNPTPWTTNRFRGLMYIYSADGIVTKFDPNGMEGRDFSFSSNESGCFQVNPPTITSTEARRSQTGRHNYPQYKIFLNDPDSTVYPSGTIGELIIPPPPAQAVVTEAFCETGFIDFTFSVTQPGSVQIDLMLNAALGAPYVDRQIIAQVNKFGNTITWDGYDGAIPPNPVPNNTQFDFSLTYINGMTHLPLYDVESNSSGFRVYLVRPPSSDPLFYWDDVHLPGQSINLTGCQSSPTSSCHPWGDPQGNENTVNTWWYVSNTSTAPVEITSKRTPGSPGPITGPEHVCEGTSATYSIDPEPNSLTYSWIIPNDTVITTDPTITIDFTGMPIGTTTIKVQGVNDCGGGGKSALDVTIHALPVANITGPISVCPNSTQTYNTQPGMSNYTWTITAGGTITAGSTTNQITVNWGAPGSDTLTISYDDPFGCGVPTPATQAVTINPNPVPDILGIDSVCVETPTLYETTPGMSNYTWTVSSGGNITSGSGTHAITVNWTTTGDKTVTLAYHDINGCATVTPTEFQVTVNPRPSPVITGPTGACINTTSVFSTSGGMSNYLWTVTPGGTIISGEGSDSVTVEWSSTGAKQISVNYTNIHGCQAQTPTIYSVTIHPRPVPVITGAVALCHHETVTYTTQTGMTDYLWNISAGGSINSGGSSHAASVTWDMTGSGTDRWIEVSYTDPNGCETSTPTRIYVNVKPIPDVVATPAQLTLCNGGTASIQLTSSVPGTISNTTFQWNMTASAVISPMALSGSNDINQIFSNSGTEPDTARFIITATANQCSSEPFVYDLIINPVSNTTLSQISQLICSGSSFSDILLTSLVPGTEFNWNVTCGPGIEVPCPPDGTGAVILGQPLSNTGNSPQQVTFNITSAFAGCPGTGATHTVTVNPVADVTLPASGQTRCAGTPSAAVPLGSNVTGAPVDYTWSVNCDPGIINCPPAGGSPSQISPVTLNLSGTTFVPQSAVYTITPAIGVCPGIPSTYTLTINPIPNISVLPANHPTICSGAATNFNLQSSVNSPSFSWSAAGQTHISPGSLTSQTDNPVQRNFTNSGTSPETVTFTLYASADGCTSLPATYTVNVNPVADVVLTSSEQTRCSGSPTSTVPISTNITGTTVQYTWSVNCQGGIIACPPSSGPANQLPSFTFNLDGSTFVQRTATYTITPSIGTCTGTPSDYVVKINPIPDLTVTPATHSAICSGDLTNFTFSSQVTSPTFTWNAAAGSNISPATLTNRTNNPVQEVFSNSGNTVQSVQFTVTASAAGCSSPPAQYSVPVNPVPHASLSVATQTICSGSATLPVNIISDVTGTALNWTVMCDAGIRPPCPSGGNGTAPASFGNVTIFNDVTSPKNVTYTITSAFDGCPGTGATHTVTVNPVADVTLPASGQTRCAGAPTAAVPLGTNVTGVTVDYTWSVSCSPGIINCPPAGGSPSQISPVTLNLSGTTFVPQSAVYTITPAIGGCPGTPSTYTLTINPIPNISVLPATHPTICSGAATNFNLQSSVNSPSFSWSAAGQTHISPGSLTSQTDNPVQRNFTNSGTSPETVTFTLYASADGCTSLPATYTVNVNPVADVVLTSSEQTRCSGSPTATVPISTNITGTTVQYTWSVNCQGGILACPPPGGPANQLPSFTYNLDGSTFVQKTATYTITPSIGTCTGTPSDYFVRINPIPDVTISPAAHPNICSAAPTSFTLHSQVAAPAFQWSASAGSAITPATLSGQTDNPVNRVFTNNGANIEPVNFSVIASADGCSSIPFNYTVNVNPRPSVSFQSLPPNPPNSQQVCSGTAFTSVPLQSNVTISGVSYAWNAVAFDPVNPTSAITGFSTPNSGNAIPGQNVVSSLLTQGIIRYNVTPTFTAGGAACDGEPAEYQVLVNPSPTVTLTPSDPTGQTICSESQSQPITFVPNASPSTYTWQAVEISGVSGAVASGTTDFIPAQTLNTTGPAQGFVKYQVTPIYQGGGTFTCPGGVSYSTIYVNPLPSPVISGRSLVCELQPDEKYSTPEIPGNSYTWTVTGATAIQQQNTREVSVTWGPYTNSPGTLLVTEVVNATGCQRSTPAYSVILQRRPIPVITGPVQFLCDGSSNHRYETAPGNSNYTWSVTGGSFTSGAGPGNNFAVVSWNSPGNHAITVNYINDLGCEGFPAGMLDLTIHPLPGTQITPGPGPDCEGEPHLYQVTSDPQCSYTWSIAPVTRGIITQGQGLAQINVNWNSSGPAVINLTATNGATTCSAPGSFSLEIHPKPVISFIPCFDLITTPAAKKFNLKGASPFVTGQAEFSGNRVALNAMTGLFEFDPFNAAPGIYPVYYSFTNNYGCSATSNPISINVQNPAPFSCGSELTDPRDGKKYNTALLGGRCWMTQNLNYGNKLDPDYLPQTDNCINEKYCSPDDPGCTFFGGFYHWDELLKYNATSSGQGLCPPGWHIPTELEWQSLIDNISAGIDPPADALAGSRLRDDLLNPGFHAFIEGIFYANKQWAFNNGTLMATMFWTSGNNNDQRALARGLNTINPSLSRYWSKKGNAFPVRCIKDLQ